MDFGRYDVVSFDCYSTLIDWEGGLISGMKPILENHGVDVTDEEILALQARTESGLQAASKPGAYVKYRKILGDTVEVRRGARLRARTARVPALDDSLRHWEPFPDTVEALRALKSRYELSIITGALVGNLLCGIQGETQYEAGQASRS